MFFIRLNLCQSLCVVCLVNFLRGLTLRLERDYPPINYLVLKYGAEYFGLVAFHKLGNPLSSQIDFLTVDDGLLVGTDLGSWL